MAHRYDGNIFLCENQGSCQSSPKKKIQIGMIIGIVVGATFLVLVTILAIRYRLRRTIDQSRRGTDGKTSSKTPR